VIEMVRRFVRQRFGSPGLVVALVVLSLLETLSLASRGGAERGFGMASWAIFVLAAGSVSRDVSSGALQMILSRPIRRTQYLFGRYAGILLSYALFLLVTCAIALLVSAIPRPGGSTGASLSIAGLAVAAGGAFLQGAFQAAILLFFSTFLPGIADLLGLLLLYLVLNLPQGLPVPWLRRAAETGRANLLPDVDWGDVFRGHAATSAAMGRWVFALSVYLALAAVIFSRRELPYGHD
jgi:ABC-2 family transporter